TNNEDAKTPKEPAGRSSPRSAHDAHSLMKSSTARYSLKTKSQLNIIQLNERSSPINHEATRKQISETAPQRRRRMRWRRHGTSMCPAGGIQARFGAGCQRRTIGVEY